MSMAPSGRCDSGLCRKVRAQEPPPSPGCVDLSRVAFLHSQENYGRKGVLSRKHEGGKRSLRKGFIHRYRIPALFLLCVPLVHSSVCPHAVNFSEIHFLAVAIGSASVLMIIVVTAVIICRQHRRKARDKRIEVADTEL